MPSDLMKRIERLEAQQATLRSNYALIVLVLDGDVEAEKARALARFRAEHGFDYDPQRMAAMQIIIGTPVSPGDVTPQ